MYANLILPDNPGDSVECNPLGFSHTHDAVYRNNVYYILNAASA